MDEVHREAVVKTEDQRKHLRQIRIILQDKDADWASLRRCRKGRACTCSDMPVSMRGLTFTLRHIHSLSLFILWPQLGRRDRQSQRCIGTKLAEASRRPSCLAPHHRAGFYLFERHFPAHLSAALLRGVITRPRRHRAKWRLWRVSSPQAYLARSLPSIRISVK